MYPYHVHIYITQAPSSDSAFQGVIIGAVLAFIFVLFQDFIRSIKERRSLHLNSLVKLEAELLCDQETINENRYAISQFIESLQQPAPYLHSLALLEVNPDHLQELHNLELNNALFTYQSHCRKIDKDVLSLQKSYDELKAGLFNGGKEQRATFVLNAPKFIEWLKRLDAALKAHEEELDRLLAEVRLHLKKDPSWLRKQKLKLMRNPKLTEEEIQEEIRKLHDEQKASGEKDVVRISKMKSRGK